MTVEVWKEEVVSKRSVQVEIAAGALPDIIIEKPDNVVLADERVSTVSFSYIYFLVLECCVCLPVWTLVEDFQ